MKITTVETVLIEEFPNVAYLRLHTDEGHVGLGESYLGARAVAAWAHESAAPYLLGKDPMLIERHWRALGGFVGYVGSGAENRGRAMVDMALWDILGQVCGQPLYQLLGGATHERVRVYNTCAGPRYARGVTTGDGVPVANWGLGGPGRYEDLEAFMHDAGGLAESLLDEGITGMKIWPLDPYAQASGGTHISARDLREGLEPFRKIREAVGDRMEVMVELHGLWDLPTAQRIARALEEFEPSWFEDPIRTDNLDALRRFADSTRIPVAASETLGTRWAFRQLLESGAAGIVMFDPSWAGGISEAKKVAGMAEAYHLPIAPHDCTGPVSFAAAVHLAVSAPNTRVQEVVRAFYAGWYRELVTHVPEVRDGHVHPLRGPGLGTALRDGVTERPDAHVQRSTGSHRA
jgi:L-alanine-DL-glutamate epimerase-like enolase superfamily enzyme